MVNTAGIDGQGTRRMTRHFPLHVLLLKYGVRWYC
jgi:hypothetical protein